MKLPTNCVHDDSGTSLAELIVGMAVMLVAMVMFTFAILTMNKASANTQNLSASSARVNNAFLQLDKTVRYASSISTPNTTLSTTAPAVKMTVFFTVRQNKESVRSSR